MVERTRIADRGTSRFAGDDHGRTVGWLFKPDTQVVAGFTFLQHGLKRAPQQ